MEYYTRHEYKSGEKMKKLLFALLAALLLVGCASVPMAGVEEDTQAKQFQPPADKAAIYVFRNGSLGGAIKMPVFINGTKIGINVAKTYLYKEVEPGTYIIVAKAEKNSELELTVEAGKNYFIWQQVRMGVMKARNTIHLVDEEKGKAGVMECELAVTQ